MRMNFTGAAEPLTRQGFKHAIEQLCVAPAELLAVLAVESRGCGFLPDRRPKILFERHWFHKLTGGRYGAAHPDLSDPSPGGYLGDAAEYTRLERAVTLDADAALQATSWGAGQVMGFHHADLGHPDVHSLVAAMQSGEDAQLHAVVGFLIARCLPQAMRAHDWATVARVYNGSAYAKNKYDQRLAGAHQQYASGVLPDIEVRRAQLYLTYLGYAPGGVDGIHGKLSRSAVVRFRAEAGLPAGDRVDAALIAALAVCLGVPAPRSKAVRRPRAAVPPRAAATRGSQRRETHHG